MKKLLPVFILLCSFLSLSAQLERAYTLGPLTYMDFKGMSLEIENTAGQIYFEYNIFPYSTDINGIKVECQQYEVGLNAAQSWIDYDQFTSDGLAYFQLLFDLEYLHTLELNKAILDMPLSNDPRAMDKINTNKEITASKMNIETQQGALADKIEKWRVHIAERIQSFEKDRRPGVYLEKNIGIDMQFGIGYNYKTKDFKEAFGNNLGLGFGVNFDLKSYYLIMTGTLGFKKMPSTLDNYPYWDQGIHRNDVMLNFALGKRIEVQSISLVPFIGVGMTSLTINKEEYDNVYPSVSETDWDLGAGVLIDIPIRKIFGYNNNSFYYRYPSRTYTEHGIRLIFQYMGRPNIYGYTGLSMTTSVNYYYYFGQVKQVDNPN